MKHQAKAITGLVRRYCVICCRETKQAKKRFKLETQFTCTECGFPYFVSNRDHDDERGYYDVGPMER
jgi:RNase P subunit RPR2